MTAHKLLGILGWFWTAALAFCYAALAIVPVRLALEEPSGIRILSVAYGLFAVFLAIAILLRLVFARKGWDRRCRLRGALLIVLSLPLAGLLVDAPAIPNDYTEADVRPSDPAVLASHGIMMKLLDQCGTLSDDPVVSEASRYKSCIPDPRDHADLIREAWAKTAETRKTLAELERFPGITEIGRDTPVGIDDPDFRKSNHNSMGLLELGRLYDVHAKLLAAEGNTREAARDLAFFHRIMRKWLPNCGTLLTKMHGIAEVGIMYGGAIEILQRKACDAETLAILKADFHPLTKEELSIRRPLIWGYLYFQHRVDGHSLDKDLMEKLCNLNGITKEEIGVATAKQVLLWPMARTVQFFLLRRNQTLRDYQATCKPLIALWSIKTETDIPLPAPKRRDGGNKLFSIAGRPDIPFPGRWLPVYNIGGRIILEEDEEPFDFAIPYYSMGAATNKACGDLLWLELCRRSGEAPPVLVDPFTRKPYAKDGHGHFFSAGRDGKLGTDDDIQPFRQAGE